MTNQSPCTLGKPVGSRFYRAVFAGTLLAIGVAALLTPLSATAQMGSKITPIDGRAGDWFGAAHAVSGDVVVVGAHHHAVDELADAGAAYVFMKNQAGVWQQIQELTSPRVTAGELFGISLTLFGDTLVVGATGGESLAGSVYVFSREGIFWTHSSTITSPGGASGDLFGWAVAPHGSALLVSAYNDGEMGEEAGAVYVFEPDDLGSWTETQKLFASDPGLGDRFGSALGVSGDRAAVGAYYDNSKAGSVYILEYDTVVKGKWSEVDKIAPEDGRAEARFGASLALDGDLLVVSAYRDPRPPIGGGFGSVYVFLHDGSVFAQDQKLVAGDGAADDFFGLSLAYSGGTLLIGVPQDEDPAQAGENFGSVSVWSRQSPDRMFDFDFELTAPDGQAEDRFGFSVSFDGLRTVVGAPLDDHGPVKVDSGSAWIF